MKFLKRIFKKFFLKKDLDKAFKKTYCIYCLAGNIQRKNYEFTCIHFETPECYKGETYENSKKIYSN